MTRKKLGIMMATIYVVALVLILILEKGVFRNVYGKNGQTTGQITEQISEVAQNGDVSLPEDAAEGAESTDGTGAQSGDGVNQTETKPETDNQTVENVTEQTKKTSLADAEKKLNELLENGQITKAETCYKNYKKEEVEGLSPEWEEKIATRKEELVLEACIASRDLYAETGDVKAAGDIIWNAGRNINDERLSKLKKLYHSAGPQYLTDMDFVDYEYKPTVEKSSVTDNFGTTYDCGIYLSAEHYSFRDTSGTYYLKGLGFTDFHAFLTPRDNLRVGSREYRIRIYVTRDGVEEEVLNEALTRSTMPIEVNLDVTGADLIRVACNYGSDFFGPSGGAYIMEPGLTKKIEIEEINQIIGVDESADEQAEGLEEAQTEDVTEDPIEAPESETDRAADAD